MGIGFNQFLQKYTNDSDGSLRALTYLMSISLKKIFELSGENKNGLYFTVDGENFILRIEKVKTSENQANPEATQH